MMRLAIIAIPLLATIAAGDEWLSLGCFGDRVFDRALPSYFGPPGVAFPAKPDEANLRPLMEGCRKGAETGGFTYFGIQNKVECWGGKEHAKPKKHGSTDKCWIGKDGFQVGGANLNAVFIIKVDGGYSEWSKWTDCGKTCGEAMKSRTRTCTNPKPRGAGKDCVGKDSEKIACELPVCGVNGGWTDYGELTTCSKTCGGGEQVRSRCCSNPLPAGGGAKCSGSNAEVKPCNTHPCPKQR